MGVRPSVQPMLVICTFRITELHYTYGCPTLIKAYVYEPYVQNHGLHYTYVCTTFNRAYVGYLFF